MDRIIQKTFELFTSNVASSKNLAVDGINPVLLVTPCDKPRLELPSLMMVKIKKGIDS